MTSSQTFKPPYNIKYLIISTLLIFLFLIIGILSKFLNANIVILYLSIFLSFIIFLSLFLPFTIRYTFNENDLTFSWLFKSIKVPYEHMIYLRDHNSPVNTFKVYGLPLLTAEYVDSDGEYFAINNGLKSGYIIEFDVDFVFGGKIFISIKNKDKNPFLKIFEEKTGLQLNQVNISI